MEKIVIAPASAGNAPNLWEYVSESGLLLHVLRCFGILVSLIIPCVALLVLVRAALKPPGFVFRKLLHIAAFAGITVMILASESWLAAALTALLLAVVIYPILAFCEKKPWFERFFLQKSPGEIKKSMLLLFVMFTAVIAFAWGVFGRADLAAASILMWGAGDAAAALVGIPLGKHKVICRFTDGKKSWEGSFAMLLTAFAVGLAVLKLAGRASWPHALVSASLGALSGAAAELFSPSEYDTVTVPAVISAVLIPLSFLP